MECAKDMYYDPATKSCAFCSQLCAHVDIQGTRDQCVWQCPGFLERLEATTISFLRSTTETTSGLSSDTSTYIIISIACVVVLALVGSVLYWKRKPLIARLKKQDCCADGTSPQPHMQETGRPSQPQDAFLANQGYPDLPCVSFACSVCTQESTSV